MVSFVRNRNRVKLEGKINCLIDLQASISPECRCHLVSAGLTWASLTALASSPTADYVCSGSSCSSCCQVCQCRTHVTACTLTPDPYSSKMSVRLLAGRSCLPFLILLTGKCETEVLNDEGPSTNSSLFTIIFPVKESLSDNYGAGSLAVQNLK